MKILKWILFVLWIIIGGYINAKYGLAIMFLYYIGGLCFALYKLFDELDK